MWISYLILLTMVAVQAGKRQQVIKGLLPKGQNAVTRGIFDQASQMQLSGNGIISKNGHASLNIKVEIRPAGGQQGGAGAEGFPPALGIGARRPGGGMRRPEAAGRRPGGGRGRPGFGGKRPGAGRPGAEEGPGAAEERPGAEEEGPGAAEEGPGAGPGTGEFSEEEQTGLLKHNDFRTIHDAPPMILDRTMCDEARAYAEKIAQMGGLKHSAHVDRPEQGENLSMGCSTNMAQAMETAVENWYNEVCDPGYDFDNGAFSSGTGHFTQVVWKESTVLGMGRAEVDQRGMKCAYIVGRYKPAGNMEGKFQENVLKGSFDAKSYCDTVSKRGRKFFDEQGQPVIVSSPMSAVDVPSAKTAPADVFPGHQVELLSGKKKSIVGNQKDKQ